jgi:hypothetical protein
MSLALPPTAASAAQPVARRSFDDCLFQVLLLRTALTGSPWVWPVALATCHDGQQALPAVVP